MRLHTSQHSEDAKEGTEPIEALEYPLIKTFNDCVTLP